MTCLICNQTPTDRCHIRTKKRGGPDEDFNLMNLCRHHHQEQHRLGIVTFYLRYLPVRAHLQSHNWEYIEPATRFDKPRLWHPSLAESGAV